MLVTERCSAAERAVIDTRNSRLLTQLCIFVQKRALKLQQRREKQAAQKKLQRELELQREQDLICKLKPSQSPVKGASPDDSSKPS